MQSASLSPSEFNPFSFFNYSPKSKSPSTCIPGSKSINLGGKELYLQIVTYHFFRCQVRWLCCAAIFVYIHIFVSYGSDGCRLMIENYKLFLDGFMHGKEIKSSSLVWVNE
ncbi:hypothetical protein NC653_013396 [Populus alba x Populus x berolinensis]|uniref:Uncharacterized protein n=1 Tax=Populus alba x Populus x berolinensis TaxID=444605 RepID=A0AAD6QVB3_9ROSI|nr:hypothetical protein NC653_013396 [Populus alba x Populus x berolinensis]